MSDAADRFPNPDTSTDPVEEIIAAYLERLYQGETLDPAEVLAAHPEDGADILDALEDYLDMGSGDEAAPPPRRRLGDYTLGKQIGRGVKGDPRRFHLHQ